MAVHLIRCIDQMVLDHGLACRPYWNSKIAKSNGKYVGGWVRDRIDATSYTDDQRADFERTREIPERGVWEVMDVTPASFAEYLEKCLAQAVRQKPDVYFYGEDEVPTIARKMVERLSTGDAQIGPTAKRVCKAFRIPATIGAIQKFLNGGQVESGRGKVAA